MSRPQCHTQMERKSNPLAQTFHVTRSECLGQPASADVHCARASCLSIWQLEAKSARCSWECAHLRTPSAYGFPDGDWHSQMAEIAIVIAVAQPCLEIAQVLCSDC